MTEIDKLAQTIWDYHHMNHQVKPADCIFALGSHDLNVADRAVDLYQEGYAPVIIFSGNVGRATKGVFTKSEAEMFADIAMKRGVPKEKIILETKSTNTGENILFTKRLLGEQQIKFKSFILVQKPYMERRTYAAFRKLWPEKECLVTSQKVSFRDYCKQSGEPKDYVINMMVGDLQRIKEYPTLGYQIEQEIPGDVWQAYLKLVTLGYTRSLIKKTYTV